MMMMVSFCFAQKKQSQKPAHKAKSKLEFGFKAGGNYSRITGDDETRYFSSKIGYHAGLLVKYDMHNNLSMQAELLWNALGTNSKDKQDENIKGKIKMDYISLPILVQYELIPRLYLETGPEFSYNISSKFIFEDGRVTDWQEYTKSMNFAWGLGAGYYITSNIAVNLRMNLGIATPFSSTENRYAKSFRHQNLQFGLLYLIR